MAKLGWRRAPRSRAGRSPSTAALLYWDKAGIETETPQDGQLYDSLSAWVRAQRARADAGLPENIKKIVALERSQRSESQTNGASRVLHRARLRQDGGIAGAACERRSSRSSAIGKQLEDQLPTTLVFREKAGEPKPAFLLKRGEYDQRGEKVERGRAGVSAAASPGAPVNRLGLAQWLIAPNHPLTARVAVNRFWLQLFGTGIVKTAEDFGAKASRPAIPELLDWLAVQFREDGWDVKRLMKRMVMSAVYRQSSRVTPETLAKDPANRLLARGPRFRLDAEMLRDQALFASGLLIETSRRREREAAAAVRALGGGRLTPTATRPTSRPTPALEKVHRRSLYTFWKRTSPPPQMTTFDAPSRESCQVRRERTNTPLQALLLDERAAIHRGGARPGRADPARGRLDDRRPLDFHVPAGHRPIARRQGPCRAGLDPQGPDGPLHEPTRRRQAIDRNGRNQARPARSTGELAAWTMIANVILNLDEAITKG